MRVEHIQADGEGDESSKELLLSKAKRKVLSLLLVRDRSRRELADRLARDGYPESVAEAAIAYAESYHYVDDLRYAVNYLRSRQEEKSRQYLKMKLSEAGVSRDVIDEAFETVREERMEQMGDAFEEAELTALRRAVLRKKGSGELSDQERQKLMKSLYSKGFHSADVARVLRMDADFSI